MKNFCLFLITLLITSLVFGQTTVVYDFADPDASTTDNLDTNISFTTAQNFGTLPVVISGGQLQLDEDIVKGGSIIITPSNGVTITNVVINASIRTNNAAYTSDTDPEVEISFVGGSYTISGITASSEVEFYQKQNGNNKEIYVDTFEVTYMVIPVTYSFSGTWSPSDPNGNATANDNLIISSGDATINDNTTCNTVIVSAGASLTINSGITLTTADLVDGLTLESTSSSFSSLINDGTISGTINYERFINAIGSGAPGNGGNDLISAPIGTDIPGGYVFQDLIDSANNSTIIASSGTQYAFAPFNNTAVAYENYEIIGGPPDPSQTLVAGQGFRVATTLGANVTFTGPFSSATVSIGITNPGAGSQWNLIGNPYPSYISSLDFLTTNTALLDDTVLDPAASAIYAYNAGTYSGSDATIGNFTIINNNTNSGLNIAPGQGFYVASDATGGSVQFLPTMRTTTGTDDFIEGRSPFQNFKLVLKLETTTNTSTSFYFNQNSSRGLDPGYDAAAFGENANNSPIYSHLVEDNTGRAMAMQSLGATDYEDITVALGVNSDQGNQVRFSINESTLPSNVNVYLEDKVKNTMTLLNTSEHVFTPTTDLSGTGRFFIHFADSALSNGNNSLEYLNIYTNTATKTIVIAGQLLQATKAKVYDLQGRMVTSAQLETSKISQSIDTSNLSKGVYVIQLTDTTKSKSEKIIIR